MLPANTLRKIAFGSLGLSALSLAMATFSSSGTGELSYQMKVKPTVMSVAYKAYGNPEAADGKYWLARIVVENNGDGPLEDVSVSYRIPEYLDWSTPRTVEEMLPGQTRVLPIFPKFPSKLTNLRSRTPSSLEVKFAWNDGSEVHEKLEVREFEFRGVNEIEYTSLPEEEMLGWADMYDNAEICAAFVTEEDPVVRQYLGEISETMGGIPICKNTEELGKVMRSIYHYQVATGMKYTGNKGVPERLGDVHSAVQSVRLPRDVIYQNSGLCIELAMLWAALGQGSSAKAYLVLVPGHCFPMLQANDGSTLAIEATGIGGANMGGTHSFEDAIRIGTEQIDKVIKGEIPGVILDVLEHQGRGIRPPEFAPVDLADLARLLDERTAKAMLQVPTDPKPEPGPNPDPDPPVIAGNFQWYRVPGVNVNMPYPSNYIADLQTTASIQQMLPALQFMANDASGQLGVEVYSSTSMTAATLMRDCQDFAYAMGASVQYQRPEAVTIGGQSGSLYSYTFQMNGVQLSGGLYLRESNQGLFAFAVGGTSSWRTLGNQLSAAVRFGN